MEWAPQRRLLKPSLLEWRLLQRSVRCSWNNVAIAMNTAEAVAANSLGACVVASISVAKFICAEQTKARCRALMSV
jgi:hypothetical protein